MSAANLGRPAETEYYAYYKTYMARVPEEEILAPMESQLEEFRRALQEIGEEQSRFRYAAGKWSIREVVGHLIDSERLFAYRALCISRGEQTPLPGFDENSYIANSAYADTPLAELLRELQLLREANLILFRRLTLDQWHRRGVANGKEVTVRALAWIIVGHFRHHEAVLKERYLPAIPK